MWLHWYLSYKLLRYKLLVFVDDKQTYDRQTDMTSLWLNLPLGLQIQSQRLMMNKMQQRTLKAKHIKMCLFDCGMIDGPIWTSYWLDFYAALEIFIETGKRFDLLKVIHSTMDERRHANQQILSSNKPRNTAKMSPILPSLLVSDNLTQGISIVHLLYVPPAEIVARVIKFPQNMTKLTFLNVL